MHGHLRLEMTQAFGALTDGLSSIIVKVSLMVTEVQQVGISILSLHADADAISTAATRLEHPGTGSSSHTNVLGPAKRSQSGHTYQHSLITQTNLGGL